jgi:hypothetical protein
VAGVYLFIPSYDHIQYTPSPLHTLYTVDVYSAVYLFTQVLNHFTDLSLEINHIGSHFSFDKNWLFTLQIEDHLFLPELNHRSGVGRDQREVKVKMTGPGRDLIKRKPLFFCSCPFHGITFRGAFGSSDAKSLRISLHDAILSRPGRNWKTRPMLRYLC